MTQRGAPGRLSRAYAWGLLAVHPVVPVAWIVLLVLATLTLPALGSGPSAPLDDLVAEKSPALAAQVRSAELFGSPLATDTQVVQRNPRGLTPEETAAFLGGALVVARKQAGPELEGLEAVVPVVNESLGALPWRERGTTAIGFLAFDPELNLVERRRLAERYVDRFLEPAAGARAGLTGPAPGRLGQYDAIVDALPLITVGSVLLIALIVGWHFRSVAAPLVALAAAAIAYGLSVRVLGWAGEQMDVAVPREVEPVLVVLLLGLVTDYAIFYLAGFRDALPGADSRFAAMRTATTGTTRVVVTAGAIVAAGTAALVAGRLDFFRAFGPGLALTAVVSVAVCVTFIPACLALLGGRLFGGGGKARPAPAVSGGLRAARPPRHWPDWLRLRLAGPFTALSAAEHAARQEGLSRWRVVVARIVTSRPVAIPVVLACTAALLFAAAGMRDIRLGVSLVPSLPASDPVRAAGEDAARGFVAGITAPVEVTLEQAGIGARRAELGRLEEALRGEPGIAAVLGPAEEPDLLGSAVTVTRDGNAARIAAVLEQEPGSPGAIDAVDRLEDRLPALVRAAGVPEGVVLRLGGETALGGDTVEAVVADLGRIAAVALLANLLLLALFMRALVAPLYLLAASVLGFAAGLGLTVTIFQGLLGNDGLTYYVPLATAVLLVSLGSDYNVFVAGRIWAQARRRRLREAVAVAAPQAAGAITVAGITLAASFALLALVPLRSFREFALLMVIGVLIDALVVRSLLIPGLVSLFGEASWWPGRRITPPRHSELLSGVERRTGLDAGAADGAIRATLATLSERITRREARTLCTQLPRAYRAALTGQGRSAERFDLPEFLRRVADREEAPEQRALGDARAVLATLAELVDETTMAYVRSQLGEDYLPLFA